MIVRCPSCKTTYKVADALVKDTNPAFRCSRCKYTFERESVETPEKAVDRTHSPEQLFSKTPVEQELTFTFASKKQDGETQKEFINPPRQSFEFPARDQGEPMSTVESTPDEPEGISPQPSLSQPLPPARETTDNVLSLEPYRDQPASTVPFLTLFGLLLMLFAFATAFHVAHPKASEEIVRSIPLVGPAVLKNNRLKNGVALQSLRVGHQTIQGNREVLVVTGIAQNQNPVVIREVRVAGQLYNLDGKEIEHQVIWIGNAISSRIIRGMTVQDISDLQRLKPLKNFEIPPGDSIPFTIVFLKSTKEIRHFTCEVLGAEGVA